MWWWSQKYKKKIIFSVYVWIKEDFIKKTDCYAPFRKPMKENKNFCLDFSNWKKNSRKCFLRSRDTNLIILINITQNSPKIFTGFPLINVAFDGRHSTCFFWEFLLYNYLFIQCIEFLFHPFKRNPFFCLWFWSQFPLWWWPFIQTLIYMNESLEKSESHEWNSIIFPKITHLV